MTSGSEQRDELLYREVGRLTRALHDALRDFHLDIGLRRFSEVEQELAEISDARSRLDYVIGMTEDAANTTMDKVDEAAPLIQSLSDEARNLLPEWDTYMRKNGAVDQAGVGNGGVVDRVGELITRTATNGEKVQEMLAEIVIAQGYQDLSGQVIKRVIALVSDVEKSLVRLIRLAGHVEEIAGLESVAESTEAVAPENDSERKIRAEGPQTRSGNSAVVAGQDDVDELLSSLGF